MRLDLLIYFALIVAFSLYKWIELFQNDMPFFHTYFEDLIAIPIFLKSALLLIQVVMPKKRCYTISKIDVVIMTIGISVYFEFILPMLDKRFVCDYFDLVCYTIGAILFWKVMNKSSYKLATT